MKKATAVAIFLAGLVLGGAVTESSARQSVDPQRCSWPPARDAVAAAPANHRVLLENDRVRVLDVVVPPGTREPVHAHCRPSAMIVLGGGRARDFDAAGKLIDEGPIVPAGASTPLAFWLERTPPHSVENLDSIPIHLVRVELKKP